MLITTTPAIEGHPITAYHGIAVGEVIIGINFLKDIAAGMRNFFGGRSQSYEKELLGARENALREMVERAQALGGNAVVGVALDYEVLGQGNMLMVTTSGTAVTIV